ncbi:MAG TPA: oligosaccharide flippase family protein [Actinomycetaceae bacterium]|nr:oligosaccharide flippase family protein [Actinomycetaceae bacterium]
MSAALPARIAQALAPILVIPALLEYLGVELYGFWMATTAVVTMLAFSDLGLGNAIMSRLPPMLADGRIAAARSLLSSSYALLTAICVLFSILFGGFAWLAPLDELLGVGDSLGPGVVRGVFLVTALSFLVNIPLSLVVRVQFARQRSGQAYLVTALTALFSMAFTILAVRLRMGVVHVVAINLMVAPLVNLVYTFGLFGWPLRDLRPTLHASDLQQVRDVLRGGLPFLALTILLTAASSADYVLIGYLVGPSEVAEFSVPARLLAQVGALIGLINMPFWSASSEALARFDITWVQRMRRSLTGLGLGMSILSVLILLFAAAPLYRWWLGGILPLSLPLVAGLGAWWITQAALSPTFMVQNGLAVVTPQLVGFPAYLALSVPLKVLLVPEFGVATVGWISTGCFLATVVPAAVYGYRSAIRPYAVVS